MCGINGFIDYSPGSAEALTNRISAMNDRIVHRGPDDDGVFVERSESYGIALGMRRLSIIDLESGKQPITSDDGNLIIVFNGEIYNYPVLRDALLQQGATFKTHSDTEVILKLYELEGPSAFRKLDGMFAFSIYDKRKGKLVIARDFFGEKPLYYTRGENRFTWCSELKSLLKVAERKPELSELGLNYFFRLTYIPAPYTIYKEVFKLEANHYLEYDLEANDFQITRIEPEFEAREVNPDFDSVKKKVKELVRESVESRSISDVPIGTFLSGGVDSSIVTLCLAQMKESPINTFSIGFEKKVFSETDKSRLVARQINSNHHEFIIGEDDLKHNIHEILLNFDEPFSDTASLPNYLVSKKTSDHVKVALTGDGGDEIFGGYNKYYVGKINNRYTSIVPEKLHGFILKNIYPLLEDKHDKRGPRYKMRKMLNTVDYEGNYFWDIISLANTESQLRELLRNERVQEDLFGYYKDRLGIQYPKSLLEFRHVDKILSLEGGMLAKVDRTSMLNSLECRAPFLNKELWAYTNGLPDSYLLKGWSKKHVLKKAFEDEFPKDFLNKTKQGFGSPVGDWLRSGLKIEMESYIEPGFLKKQDLFSSDYIVNLVREHLDGKRDNTFQVWAFYCFQKWYKNVYN